MLSYQYKKIGLGGIVLSIILWILGVVNDFEDTYIRISAFVLLIAISLVVFSKEKVETPAMVQVKYELFFRTFAGGLLFFIILTTVNVALAGGGFSVDTFTAHLKTVGVLQFSTVFLFVFYSYFRQKIKK